MEGQLEVYSPKCVSMYIWLENRPILKSSSLYDEKWASESKGNVYMKYFAHSDGSINWH